MRGAIVGFAASLACLVSAGASAGEDQLCRNGLFATSDAIRLARVGPGGPMHFLDDMNGCPSTAPTCRRRAYLLAGDIVLIGQTMGEYVCAYFPNKNGGSAGWAPSSRLVVQSVVADPPLAAWVGRWTLGDDAIELRVMSGKLVGEGEAYWPSANPSLKDRPGGPNIGQFNGIGALRGNAAEFIDGEGEFACKVRLTLIVPYLVARDNGYCGGHNVTFTGVYQKRR